MKPTELNVELRKTGTEQINAESGPFRSCVPEFHIKMASVRRT
jgi:hypothetical protein